ncbi:tRNA pseudouridine38-40 synthase [Natronocella acetinitrilica]|uniref:tRNA pseudouridine synthase A n=1 Tax=Natronocella acetinitrilica TaxID=414046 RepID=A0AAE3G2X8_9GAMM|nr:tRNA pseudouridine(38-40) synthase TruA [Natronocella acetinitrilica]MCP1673721.1 tRNA pseudouridine38-40 synthase [Natronocella acetinitrilica]
MRIALGVEYDGRRYRGWQSQHHAPSIQACLEQALSKVAAAPIAVTCAGRTDAGVHALGQVVHFDTDADRPMHGWRLGATTGMPDDIAVCWAQPVPEHFNARFSAVSRQYRYVLLNRPVRPALFHGKVGWTWKPLDADRMQQAGTHLLGEQDFSAFRSVECQARHARRSLSRLQITRDGDFIYFDVVANAFLHHMVRNIVGTLMVVGAAEKPTDWVADVLQGRDRKRAGPTAAADGLYFVAVRYGEDFGLPAPPVPPAFRFPSDG